MKDPAFLEEARRNDLEVRPVDGAALEKLVTEVYATPPDVVAMAKAATKEQGQ